MDWGAGILAQPHVSVIGIISGLRSRYQPITELMKYTASVDKTRHFSTNN